MKHRNLSITAFAAILSLCAINEAQAVSICIDPGHGGSDPGAQGCNLSEAEINLAVSLKLKPLLEAAGYTVYMTRTTDTDVSLAGRSSFANSKGVTTFASIHTNSAAAVASGVETYCYTGCTVNKKDAYQQANNIQKEMCAVWCGDDKLKNRGVKEANFHVVRETSMPATLTELGFINNCNMDAKYLADNGHRQEAAAAHCKAITAKWGGDSSKCNGGGGNQQQTGKVMAGVFHDSVGEANWLGGATYKIGSDTQITRDSYQMMTFTVNVGPYTATASKNGYNTVTRTDCEPANANSTSWCSIALTAQSAQTKGKATGNVKDGSTSQNIAANITISTGQTASYDGKTDWSFDLDAGTYTIKAAADGYEENSVSCVVNAGKTSACPITLTPQKGTITGAVFDAGTQNKVAATVSLNGIQMAYDGSRDWLFSVEPGNYTATATTEDGKTGSASCKAERGKSTTCNIEVSQGAGKGMIRGTLTDAKSGNKLIGDVKVVGTDQVYHYTAADFWQFYLTAGEYSLEGSSAGYAPKTVKCTAQEGSATDCPIALDAEDTVVEGNVYVGSDPSALVAATVTVGDNTIEYDGVNSWTISLEPGEYTFTATDGTRSGSATCTIVAGRINTCDISINDGTNTGALKGFVYDDRNETLRIAATIQIQGAGTIEYSGFGEWSVAGLPEGAHTITTSAEGYYENTVVCNVVATEETYCPIALTFIKGDGTPDGNTNSVAADIYLIPGESCSAMPLGTRKSLPFAIVCAFGLLGACVLRRRREA